MTAVDLVIAIRSTWNSLTHEQQEELYNLVMALRRDSALAQAAQYQDPMCRFFAEQLAPADNSHARLAGSEPNPKAIDV